jgi:hypothetical protein
MPRDDLRGWNVRGRRGLILAIVCAAASSLASAQDGSPNRDLSFVGKWSGESISDERGVVRWTIDRGVDGRYAAQRTSVRRGGATEDREEGQWSVRDGVLIHEPTSGGDASRRAWRATALTADCMEMQAIEPVSSQPLNPAWRFGECRLPGTRPLPERIHHRCAMEGPGMQGGTLDLQIVREADGQYHALGDGERDPQAVDVRDYPVLRGFKPGLVDTMTNAGEGLLVLVQMNLERSGSLRRALGFDPSLARFVRAWVISPPRPDRPMDYYSAGRFVLMQAFDDEGRLLGGAAYTPFIVACPAKQ